MKMNFPWQVHICHTEYSQQADACAGRRQPADLLSLELTEREPLP